MKNKFKVGNNVYHRYKNTYWTVVSISGQFIVAEKQFDKGLKVTTTKMIKIYPIACFELIDRQWYESKGYYQKGKLWNLVIENTNRRT